MPISKVRDIITTNVKLPGHGSGLPGKVNLFHIVPLDPVAKAGLAEHVPANKSMCFVSIWGAEDDEPGVYAEDRCLPEMGSMEIKKNCDKPLRRVM